MVRAPAVLAEHALDLVAEFIASRRAVAKSICSSLALVVLALFSFGADAKQPRSAAAKAEFQRLNPCPATGEHRGPCPGWIVDHIHPLCANGDDLPSNMQWQTIEDAKAKDREERRLCRASG